MKKLFVAGIAAAAFYGVPALAADVPVKAPVVKAPVVAAVYNWTGCYIGGNVGGGWARKENIDLEGPESLGAHTASGILAGGQVGCDYQVGQMIVFGAQGMFDWSNLRGQNTIPQNPAVAYTTRISSIGSLTGRVGLALAPQALVYVKGGALWLRDKHEQLLPQPTVNASETQTWTGWTVGGGLEYLLASNWSVFAEYSYAGFGDKTTTFVGCTAPCINQKLSLQTVLVGLNYRFGGGPIRASY